MGKFIKPEVEPKRNPNVSSTFGNVHYEVRGNKIYLVEDK
jgi:hypothetical protein